MYVCVCVGGWVCMLANKKKTADRNDFKLGTVVVLVTVSKPIDFGFKRSGLELGLE